MRSHYKPLGKYIRPVKVRNSDEAALPLKGISINKKFMPSVANVNGTDLSNYRVVSKGQFAYNPMHVGRDEVLPISLLQNDEKVIVSPAYVVFEIIDPEELLPEYLMMWFRRSEFDRNAWFTTDSSVRGGFSWDDFCAMELPIPSPKKQREIVDEYNTIINRITLNEQLCQTLEETAQTLYKHWFVDFEFPMPLEYAQSIGKPDRAGQPYKSSGGEMEFCKELNLQIPQVWKCSRLAELSFISAGGDRPQLFSQYKCGQCPIPIYSNGTFNDGLYGFTNKAVVHEKSVTISARGGIGFTALRLEPYVPIVRLIVLKPKTDFFLNYIFETVKRFQFTEGTSSAQSQLTVPDISSYKLLEPSQEIVKNYHWITQSLYNLISEKKAYGVFFEKLVETILNRMTKFQNEKIAV